MRSIKILSLHSLESPYGVWARKISNRAKSGRFGQNRANSGNFGQNRFCRRKPRTILIPYKAKWYIRTRTWFLSKKAIIFELWMKIYDKNRFAHICPILPRFARICPILPGFAGLYFLYIIKEFINLIICRRNLQTIWFLPIEKLFVNTLSNVSSK